MQIMNNDIHKQFLIPFGNRPSLQLIYIYIYINIYKTKVKGTACIRKLDDTEVINKILKTHIYIYIYIYTRVVQKILSLAQKEEHSRTLVTHYRF